MPGDSQVGCSEASPSALPSPEHSKLEPTKSAVPNTMLGATTIAAILGLAGSALAQCGAAPVNQLVGFGAGTTGGGSGSGTTVTSCSQLETAVKNGGVIRVSGTLSNCGDVRLVSGTTLIGVGSNSGTFSSLGAYRASSSDRGSLTLSYRLHWKHHQSPQDFQRHHSKPQLPHSCQGR
jgi:hypothetical protein